jgi:Ca2+-binding EF-hand superfamily protein
VFQQSKVFGQMKQSESALVSKEALAEFDKDGDGKLNREEFMEAFANLNEN